MNHAPTVHTDFKGFGFFCTESNYEINPILSSFHLTKAGAYKAMRKWKIDRWHEEFNMWTRKERRKEMRGKFCQYDECFIQPVTYRIYI